MRLILDYEKARQTDDEELVNVRADWKGRRLLLRMGPAGCETQRTIEPGTAIDPAEIACPPLLVELVLAMFGETAIHPPTRKREGYREIFDYHRPKRISL